MNGKNLIKFFLTFFLFTSSAFALSSWQIVPEKSSIMFTAMQNNASVTGKFAKWDGEINFDPKQLNLSKIRIIIDMNSVTTPFGDVATTLKTPDWFDVKLFPQAEFSATQFTKISDKLYKVIGNLTIRDKTVPVTIFFTLVNYSSNKAVVEGTTLLKRTQFGIGQGEWLSTDVIKDDVHVDFNLTAIPR